MYMVITADDVKSLRGKFILQIEKDKQFRGLTDDSWGFWKDKRLRYVSGLTLARHDGFYNKVFDTEQAFADYFNDPNGDGLRAHRLLTTKELAFVFKKMTEENY